MTAPAEISIEDYHEYADEYLENLLVKLLDLGETKLGFDAEFSVCADLCSVVFTY